MVPKACDDMMQVGRLQNFDGNLSAQGKLIFQVGMLASLISNAADQSLTFVYLSSFSAVLSRLQLFLLCHYSSFEV